MTIRRLKARFGQATVAAGMADNPTVAALVQRCAAALRESRQKSLHWSGSGREGSHNLLEDMVGAAGIEPATPTMST